MLGDLLGGIGGKVAKAAIPKFAEEMADYAVDLLHKHMTAAGIDPLTPKQDTQVKAFVKNLIIVEASKNAT